MILIPELEKILILTPRTGTTSFKNAILDKYPMSMLLYRHMEADGVPCGYDRWQKIGVVRHPTERLWSLYKYLKTFDGDYEPAYIKAMNDSVQNMDFSEWILNNEAVFTNPYMTGSDRFIVRYSVRHHIPETRKSQFMYLRPDLGTWIFKFTELHRLASELVVEIDKFNDTPKEPVPCLTDEARKHIVKYLSWDLEAAKTP